MRGADCSRLGGRFPTPTLPIPPSDRPARRRLFPDCAPWRYGQAGGKIEPALNPAQMERGGLRHRHPLRLAALFRFAEPDVIAIRPRTHADRHLARVCFCPMSVRRSAEDGGRPARVINNNKHWRVWRLFIKFSVVAPNTRPQIVQSCIVHCRFPGQMRNRPQITGPPRPRSRPGGAQAIAVHTHRRQTGILSLPEGDRIGLCCFGNEASDGRPQLVIGQVGWCSR